LNLAHVTKGDGNDKRPFGSTFWYNGARSVWYAEREDAPALDNVIHVGLIDRKNNLGAKRSSLAVRVEFGDRIVVSKADVADAEQFSRHLPVSQQVRALLARGPMTLAHLAERTGGKVESIERQARRDPDLHMVPGTDGIMRVALNNSRVS
jgi:G3E family GTPase